MKRVVHPSYDSNTIQNDFMLMKLDNKVDSPRVELNNNNNIPADDLDVTVIGFGSTKARVDVNFTDDRTDYLIYNEVSERMESFDDDFLTPRIDTLQKVVVQVVPHSSCNGPSMYSGFIDKQTMICAGTEAGGMDACLGDSGGPLTITQNSQFVQVGVVSFGAGCARPDKPGAYSRISTAYDWIQDELCDLSNNPPLTCKQPSKSPTTPPTQLPSPVPTKLPTKTPIAYPNQTSKQTSLSPCVDSIFLERDQIINEGETIERNGVFLFQNPNGNLQIIEGPPKDPGSLIWESGKVSQAGAKYFTRLQGDGHLITLKVKNGNQSLHWKSNTSEDGTLDYYFLLACSNTRNGYSNVAIYQGLPSEGGWGIITWDTIYHTASPSSDLMNSFPSAYPTKATPDLCFDAIFLEGDQIINHGETVEKIGSFLYHNPNGNLEVRMGTIQSPGSLVWESGKVGQKEATYYTKLQGDGNLITWKVENGNKSLHWKSNTSENDSFKYYFLLGCGDTQGDYLRVSIYQSLPSEGGRDIITWSTAYHVTRPPSDLSSPYPTTGVESVTCDDLILLKRDQIINGGETTEREGAFLFQKMNGNLEVREGTPQNPGNLVWESGAASQTDATYFTKLQGDGNLITWRIKNGTKSLHWKSNTSEDDTQDYFFLLECRSGNVAIYQGLPSEGGRDILTVVRSDCC